MRISIMPCLLTTIDSKGLGKLWRNLNVTLQKIYSGSQWVVDRKYSAELDVVMSNALDLKLCETLYRAECPLASSLYGFKLKGAFSKAPVFQIDPIINMHHCCICRKSSLLQFILRMNDYMIGVLLLGYHKKKFCLTLKKH